MGALVAICRDRLGEVGKRRQVCPKLQRAALEIYCVLSAMGSGPTCVARPLCAARPPSNPIVRLCLTAQVLWCNGYHSGL